MFYPFRCWPPLIIFGVTVRFTYFFCRIMRASKECSVLHLQVTGHSDIYYHIYYDYRDIYIIMVSTLTLPWCPWPLKSCPGYSLETVRCRKLKT